jgi:hypothetical protein
LLTQHRLPADAADPRRDSVKNLAVVFLPYRYCLLLMIDAQTSSPVIFTFGSFDFCLRT